MCNVINTNKRFSTNLNYVIDYLFGYTLDSYR